MKVKQIRRSGGSNIVIAWVPVLLKNFLLKSKENGEKSRKVLNEDIKYVLKLNSNVNSRRMSTEYKSEVCVDILSASSPGFFSSSRTLPLDMTSRGLPKEFSKCSLSHFLPTKSIFLPCPRLKGYVSSKHLIMFTRKADLLRKTGEKNTDRYNYLKELINEYTTTRSFEAKRQTLANLANFAYDPINYEYMKQLHVADLFLAQLSESSEELIHFGLSGLCNLICDPEFREYIISLNGVYLVTQQLLHANEEISVNALTTLYYIFESEGVVVTPDLLEKVKLYKDSSNPRLKNLGAIFLQTYSK